MDGKNACDRDTIADTNINVLLRKSIIKFRFSTKLIYSKFQNDYIIPKGYFAQYLLLTLFILFYCVLFSLEILARHLLINFCSCIISYWAGHYVNTVKEFIGWVSKIKKATNDPVRNEISGFCITVSHFSV